MQKKFKEWKSLWGFGADTFLIVVANKVMKIFNTYIYQLTSHSANLLKGKWLYSRAASYPTLKKMMRLRNYNSSSVLLYIFFSHTVLCCFLWRALGHGTFGELFHNVCTMGFLLTASSFCLGFAYYTRNLTWCKVWLLPWRLLSFY